MSQTWNSANGPKSPSSPAYERIVNEAPMTPAQDATALADRFHAILCERTKITSREDADGLLALLSEYGLEIVEQSATAGSTPSASAGPQAEAGQPITYDYDAKGNIVLPLGAPFDGESVLIKLASGWCEARWEAATQFETADGTEHIGFDWTCMDGNFTAELDDAKFWMPLADAHPQPQQADGRGAVIDAFEAGALAVHREWLAAHDRGEGPPRGDPEFGEAARDYALSQAPATDGAGGIDD